MSQESLTAAAAVPPEAPRRAPVPVLGLIVVVLAIAATAAAHFAPEETYARLVGRNFDVWLDRKWWTLVTSGFVHAGLLHLFFNCYWIWAFSLLLEPAFGRARVLALFLATAWAGSAAELAWSAQSGIGLSGVVYGYFGFLLVNRGRHPVFAALLTRQNMALLLGWLVLCFPLTAAGIMNVANFAHLGGFVAGILLGLGVPGSRWRRPAWIATTAFFAASVVPPAWAPWHEDWQLVVAQRALERKDYDAAMPALARLRAKYPDYLWAWQTEATLRLQRNHYRSARELLDSLIERAPGPRHLNDLAWLLATCPAPEIRDGARAVRLATEACEATDWKDAAVLDTLAAAHAEAGDFAAAVKWSTESLKFSAGEMTGELQKHLESFRAGQAWRVPGSPKDLSPSR